MSTDSAAQASSSPGLSSSSSSSVLKLACRSASSAGKRKPFDISSSASFAVLQEELERLTAISPKRQKITLDYPPRTLSCESTDVLSSLDLPSGTLLSVEAMDTSADGAAPTSASAPSHCPVPAPAKKSSASAASSSSSSRLSGAQSTQPSSASTTSSKPPAKPSSVQQQSASSSNSASPQEQEKDPDHVPMTDDPGDPSSSSSSSSPAAAPTKDDEAKYSVPSPNPVLEQPILDALNTLLFGRRPVANDVDRWRSQGFTFSDDPALPFGLIQIYGGPCGILAPVQAYILQDLIFSDQKIASSQDDAVPLRPTVQQRTDALVRTLANIIVRASTNPAESYIVLSAPQGDKIRRNPPVIGQDALRQFIRDNLVSFRSNVGVLLFVYIVILNRGLDTTKSDGDDPGQPLVQRFGHCSQDLVNLMICGQAVTNAFDGTKKLGDTDEENRGADVYAMRGIPQRNDVGFLSVLEALRYGEVGDYYKTPNFPIWVVGSSSHYTVLFALDKNVGKLSREERRKREMKRVFQEFDPHQTGFVSLDKLDTLVARLDLPFTAEQIRNNMRSDAGVLLFNELYNSIVRCETPKFEWNCPACTYLNKEDSVFCEICTATKPEPAAPSQSTIEHASQPKEFSLFHYNGIQGPKSAKAECRKVHVWPDRGESLNYGAENLTVVIQTKWPYALVEYPGAFDREPKIT